MTKQRSKKLFLINVIFQIFLSLVVNACVIKQNNSVNPYPTMAFEDSEMILQTPSEQNTGGQNSIKTEFANEDDELEPILPPGDYILYEKNLKVLAISQDKKIYTIMDEMPSYDLIFSRDLKKVAFVSTDNDEAIFIKDLNTNKLNKINVDKYCEYTIPLLGSWSPDNNFISFICDQVYALNVSTTEIYQISDIEPHVNFFWSCLVFKWFRNFL